MGQTREEKRARWRKYYKENKEKRRAYSREYQRQNKKQCTTLRYRTRLLSKYGITLDDYNALWITQDGICAICGGTNNNGSRLCVDHNHKTGEIRGLLCHCCNRLLGFVKDDTAILMSAITYLSK